MENATGGAAILVVEDDPAIRRLVTMVLKREGYRIDTASDGVEAVLKLGVAEYEVIVLDLMMPNLDGFTLLKTMSESDPERLKTIIITSAASPAVIRARLAATPFAVIPKPFDITHLIDTVRSCIESRKAQPLN